MEYKQIYVVEDTAVTRLMLITILEENGYTVIGSTSLAEIAWDEIQKLNPDLVLTDINLPGDKNGIWLGKQLNNQTTIPFIYITAYQDQHTSEEITNTSPMGFIVKPINSIQLITTINIALNLNRHATKNNVLIQDGQRTININTDEIDYLQSEGNYVHIYMENNHFLIRTTLTNLLEKLPKENFQRIHQRTAFNINKKFKFTKDTIEINGLSLSISDKFKEEIKSRLKLD